MKEKILIYIAIAIGLLAVAALLVRLLTFFYLFVLCKKPSSNERSKNEYDEDILKANLKIPKSQSQIKAEFLSLQKERNYEVIAPEVENENQDDFEIVGIVEPVGPWTSLILGKELSKMLRRRASVKGGYWTNRIKAEYQSNQRERGRGR